MLKLVEIIASPRAAKKWRAVFNRDGRMVHTDFGASGYDDYITSKDEARRELYLRRHRKDLDTEDPSRAGFLSYYILWGPTTNFAENVRLYKNKFHL